MTTAILTTVALLGLATILLYIALAYGAEQIEQGEEESDNE